MSYWNELSCFLKVQTAYKICLWWLRHFNSQWHDMSKFKCEGLCVQSGTDETLPQSVSHASAVGSVTPTGPILKLAVSSCHLLQCRKACSQHGWKLYRWSWACTHDTEPHCYGAAAACYATVGWWNWVGGGEEWPLEWVGLVAVFAVASWTPVLVSDVWHIHWQNSQRRLVYSNCGGWLPWLLWLPQGTAGAILVPLLLHEPASSGLGC